MVENNSPRNQTRNLLEEELQAIAQNGHNNQFV